MRVVLLITGLAVGTPALASESWGPWDDRWAPVGEVEAVAAASGPRRGLFEALYRWYRRSSSPRDGVRCPYYPTCSGYFILSVRQRGPVLGVLFTMDRLMREYPGMEKADHYPLVMPHDTPRLLDFPPPRRRPGRGTD